MGNPRQGRPGLRTASRRNALELCFEAYLIPLVSQFVHGWWTRLLASFKQGSVNGKDSVALSLEHLEEEVTQKGMLKVVHAPPHLLKTFS